MSKYSEQFKLAIVQQYSSGTAGYRQLANEHTVPDSMVRLWVRLSRAHGTDGLAKKFSHYSAKFKFAVLRHMWDDDLSYTRWQRRLTSAILAALRIGSAAIIAAI